MERLIEFLLRYKHCFLFILLEVVALLLLFSKRVHHSAIQTSAINSVVGYSNDLANRWYTYLDLKRENEQLLLEKANIENQYLHLKQEFENYKANNQVNLDSIKRASGLSVLTTAEIISTNKATNNPYLIINRGKAEGVNINMGVLSKHGVVGSIMSVSEHYAIVIPITNPNFQLNCLSSRTGSSGTLVSYGLEQYSLLKNVPNHVKIEVGDSIMTGKDSYIFPESLFVGRIAPQDNDKNPYSYRVELATDFNRLHNVYIIDKKKDPEVMELEASIKTDD